MDNKKSNYDYYKLRSVLRDAGLTVDQAHALASGIEAESPGLIKKALDSRFEKLFEAEHAEERQQQERDSQTLSELEEIDRQVTQAMSDSMHPATETFSREQLRESMARIRAQEEMQLSARELADARESAARAMSLPGDNWKDLL